MEDKNKNQIPVVALDDDKDLLELPKKELNEIVEKALTKFYQEQGLLKLKTQNTPKPNKSELEDNPNYVFSKMVSAIYHNDKDTIQEILTKSTPAQTEGTPADGGYFVPAVTMATIMDLIPSYNQGMGVFGKIPMGKTNKVNMPVGDTGVSVSWPGEAGAITPSKATFKNALLEAKKAAGLAIISNELLEDANVDLGAYLLKLFARGFGIAFDTQFYQGTGTVFDGLCHNVTGWGNAVNVASVNAITYDKIVDAIYGIDQTYLNGAIWQMHRSVLGAIRKLKTTDGLPIFNPAFGGTPASLMEFPVVLVEAMPTNVVDGKATAIAVLGNPNNSLIGTKAEMTVTILKEAVIGDYNLATMDMSAIRVTMRVAFNKGNVKGYSGLVIPAP